VVYESLRCARNNCPYQYFEKSYLNKLAYTIFDFDRQKRNILQTPNIETGKFDLA
jgi:hypothetical protein